MPALPAPTDHSLAAADFRDHVSPHCHHWATLWSKADGPESPD